MDSYEFLKEQKDRITSRNLAPLNALCDALETAINTVECASIGLDGEELPWYKQAHKALALAGRPWTGRRGQFPPACCRWTKYKESDEFGFDHYSTTCGRDTGNSGEFAPAWTHCPYCGKTLIVIAGTLNEQN